MNATNDSNAPASRFLKERLKVLGRYLDMLLRIEDDTDVEATVASIRKSVNFKGINAWILFFAIIIASVGLNVNSTAVIIGAMLISPLMGPINGLGLAVGTYDIELLKRSLRNLAVMVSISLVASTLYFLLSPLGDAQSELLARTRPTIFDVLIATFGGFAGIVAASRKDQPFTVISGVAIATALMPPLCTAGYGLATLQLKYFAGAFYLFFINAFFIALATFIMVRYLHFPMCKFLNERREKTVKRSIVIASLLVLIPSCITAFQVVKESYFNSRAGKFIASLQESSLLNGNTQLLKYEKNYTRKGTSIELFVVGEGITPMQTDSLKKVMRDEYGLSGTDLVIRQNGLFDSERQAEVLKNIIASKEEQISDKDETIRHLNDSIAKAVSNSQFFVSKAKIIGDKYNNDIASIAIVNASHYDTGSQTAKKVPTIFIMWKDGQRSEAVLNELRNWAPTLLDVPEVRIVESR